jgi:hypothetical protein
MIPSSIVQAGNLARFRVFVPKERTARSSASLSHNYNLIYAISFILDAIYQLA